MKWGGCSRRLQYGLLQYNVEGKGAINEVREVNEERDRKEVIKEGIRVKGKVRGSLGRDGTER